MANPPMPPETLRAAVAARLPGNVAAAIAEFLAGGRSGSLILHVDKGRLTGIRVESYTKALDSAE